RKEFIAIINQFILNLEILNLQSFTILLIIADEKPYCVQCFSKKYNPKCNGCGEILIDSCLIALDKHWHPRCFTCAACKQPLPNGEHYIIDDLPYDRDCHWEKRLEKRIRIAQETHTRMDH
ncbi:unnamed protein product, partial [Onchocerca flexuosa]|uniref:LIM zinc-binding domain-containing protein n=1 Tax=Onchocerca flexuosa TaxID=387005 RepID=A0A183HNU8_9BILA